MSRTIELDFVNEIAAKLSKAGVNFQREPSIMGLRPDFILIGPDGRRIILEVKTWKATIPNLQRAYQQALLYKRQSSVHDAFVLMSSLSRSQPGRKLLSATDFLKHLAPKHVPTPERHRPKPLAKTTRTKKPHIFAAMPFKPEYDDAYFVAMSAAADAVGSVCIRVDHSGFTGDIPTQIKQLIRRSIAVIADVSEARPNVLFEMGFAHASSRPVVQICSTAPETAPFDVRNDNTLFYTKGQTHKLKTQLVKRLKALLKS